MEGHQPKLYNLNKALVEARMMRKILKIKNPTAGQITLTNRYLDDIEALKKTTNKQEIKKFILTQEIWNNALRYFQENKEELIKLAISSRDKAVSHREIPFKVGCAILGIEPKASELNYGVYASYNFKLQPGPREGKDKRCAERAGVEMAKKNSTIIVAFVVVSKETNTEGGDNTRNTLHPCAECRKMFREAIYKGFLKEDAIICTVNDSDPNKIIEEQTTIKNLLDLYND